MKKWETREWWESRKWTREEIEEMEKEELERLSKQPWFESGKPCKTDIFAERDWQEEFELIWGKWGCHGIGKLKRKFGPLCTNSFQELLWECLLKQFSI